MFSHGYGMGWGMAGVGMWVGWVLIVLAIVAVVVLLMRSGTTAATPGGGAGASRARDILSERYARGEISTEEYRERAAELGR